MSKATYTDWLDMWRHLCAQTDFAADRTKFYARLMETQAEPGNVAKTHEKWQRLELFCMVELWRHYNRHHKWFGRTAFIPNLHKYQFVLDTDHMQQLETELRESNQSPVLIS